MAAIRGKGFGDLNRIDYYIIFLNHLTGIVDVPACFIQRGINQGYAGLLFRFHNRSTRIYSRFIARPDLIHEPIFSQATNPSKVSHLSLIEPISNSFNCVYSI